eukprot:GFUD01020429.1.p1 GENE.GFUD01020429.1~~GFUD01020429.1.p1  ORF type:complete len:441 (-),score=112.51 GFUD01020429.1:133-1455(-)
MDIITLKQEDKHVSIGEYLYDGMSSETYHTVQIHCRDGVMTESSLVVSLIFSKILIEEKIDVTEAVFVLPEVNIREMKKIVNNAYDQQFFATQSTGAGHSRKREQEENIVVKVEETWIEEGMKVDDLRDRLDKNIDTSRDLDPSVEDYDPSYSDENENKSFEENGSFFSCDKCTYKTIHSYNYKRHIQTQRCTNNTWGDKCQFCDKPFPTKDAMRVHRRRMHKEEWQNFKEERQKDSCTICGKVQLNMGMSKELHLKKCLKKQEYLAIKVISDPVERRKLKKKFRGIAESIDKNSEDSKSIFNKSGGLKTLSSEIPVPISEDSKLKLENHKAQSAIKVPCEVCAQLIRKDHMRKHLVHVHKIGEIKKVQHIYPKVQCPHCDRKVSCVTLRKHLRTVHSLRGGLENMEVECIFCLIKYPMSGFEYHVRHSCFARNKKQGCD